MLFVRKHPLYQISPTHLRQFLAPPLTCCLPFPNLLNSISFLYKAPLPTTALLEKKEGKNHVKNMFLHLNGFCQPRFLDAPTCILHQIGSLVGRQFMIFHVQNLLFTPRFPLFYCHFTPFLHTFSIARKGFYPYIHSIFIHFASHLGANHSAFSGKLPCI